MIAIEIKKFCKSYGSVEAVRDISLDIAQGELFGLIGPDGAGKTSLMRTICTLLIPDQGSIKVNGMDVTKNVTEIRALIGYMPQRFSLYQDLTVEQNLKFFAELFQVPVDEQQKRLAELYQFSRLEPFKKRQAGALSGGMKQKLALSCALIHTPDILILDEPTFGVDPVSRDEFWNILHTIRGSGTTILVSTAYMNEANLCDRVSLIFNGKIQATDKPDLLRGNFQYPLFEIRAQDLKQMVDFFDQYPEVHTIQKFGDTLHLSFKNLPAESQWQKWKSLAQGNLQGWKTIEPSIEDIFLEQMENGNE